MRNGRMRVRRVIATGMAAVLLAGTGYAIGSGRHAPGAAGPAGEQVHAAGDNWIALPMLMKSANLADLPTPIVVQVTATSIPPTTTPTPRPPTATNTPEATDAPTLTSTPTEEPSSPTPEPTHTIEATPTEPPKPTPASECRELVVNGSFEQGVTGWDLYTNAGARYDRLARVINQPADNRITKPHGGHWVAEFGGGTGPGDGWVDELTNPDPATARDWTLPAAQDIVSATLAFYYAVETQEPRNFVPNDRFTVAFINGDKSARSEVLQSPLSEESVEQGTWRAYRFDVTAQLTQRRQWDRARLIMRSENGETLATWHFVDDVSLTLCTKPKPLLVHR